MPEELLSYDEHLRVIFDSNKPVANSNLVYLSNLDSEELELLKQAWAKANTKRRQQVISHLVHLSEIDFKLDFSITFGFCLHDTDETVRIQAIAGLEAEENHMLIAPLIQALKEDTSTKVRAAACVALGKFALLGELGKLPAHYAEKVYTALLDVLDNETESDEVKRRALEAIAPFNLPRIKGLIKEAYHSSDIKVKASALYAMGRNCDPAWLATILTELSSNEAELRYEAANACGEIDAEEAVPHLVRLTKDEDIQVQEAAIKALGEIGGDEAKQTLSELARNPQSRVQQAAKSSLEELNLCEDPLFLEL